MKSFMAAIRDLEAEIEHSAKLQNKTVMELTDSIIQQLHAKNEVLAQVDEGLESIRTGRTLSVEEVNVGIAEMEAEEHPLRVVRFSI